MKKEAALKYKGLKTKTSDVKRSKPKMQGAQNKDLQWKERQLQNARGSKQRPLMKKEATTKCKGLKTKSSDEKSGNPKTHKGIKIEGGFMNQKLGTVSSPKPAPLN
jgi:hypothetical protein